MAELMATPKKRRQPVSPRRRKVAKKAVRKAATPETVSFDCDCDDEHVTCEAWVSFTTIGGPVQMTARGKRGDYATMRLSPASARRLAAALMKLAKGGGRG